MGITRVLTVVLLVLNGYAISSDPSYQALSDLLSQALETRSLCLETGVAQIRHLHVSQL